MESSLWEGDTGMDYFSLTVMGSRLAISVAARTGPLAFQSQRGPWLREGRQATEDLGQLTRAITPHGTWRIGANLSAGDSVDVALRKLMAFFGNEHPTMCERSIVQARSLTFSGAPLFSGPKGTPCQALPHGALCIQARELTTCRIQELDQRAAESREQPEGIRTALSDQVGHTASNSCASSRSSHDRDTSTANLEIDARCPLLERLELVMCRAVRVLDLQSVLPLQPTEPFRQLV